MLPEHHIGVAIVVGGLDQLLLQPFPLVPPVFQPVLCLNPFLPVKGRRFPFGLLSVNLPDLPQVFVLRHPRHVQPGVSFLELPPHCAFLRRLERLLIHAQHKLLDVHVHGIVGREACCRDFLVTVNVPCFLLLLIDLLAAFR